MGGFGKYLSCLFQKTVFSDDPCHTWENWVVGEHKDWSLTRDIKQVSQMKKLRVKPGESQLRYSILSWIWKSINSILFASLIMFILAFFVRFKKQSVSFLMSTRYIVFTIDIAAAVSIFSGMGLCTGRIECWGVRTGFRV